jgi:hypothetical protein
MFGWSYACTAIVVVVVVVVVVDEEEDDICDCSVIVAVVAVDGVVEGFVFTVWSANDTPRACVGCVTDDDDEPLLLLLLPLPLPLLLLALGVDDEPLPADCPSVGPCACPCDDDGRITNARDCSGIDVINVRSGDTSRSFSSIYYTDNHKRQRDNE